MDEVGVLHIESKTKDTTEVKKRLNRYAEITKNKPYYELKTLYNQMLANSYREDKGILARIVSFFLVPSPKQVRYGRFLEVGCNTGVFLEQLDNEWDKYGVEISGEAYAVAKNNNKNVYNTTLENFDSDLRFDFIYSCHVIEHVVKFREFIQSMYKYLEKGGTCVVLTPNTGSLTYKLFRKHWDPLYRPTHFTMFNIGNLSAAMEKEGFTIKKTATYDMGVLSSSAMKALKTSKIFNNYVITIVMYLLTFPIGIVLSKLNLGDALYIEATK